MRLNNFFKLALILTFGLGVYACGGSDDTNKEDETTEDSSATENEIKENLQKVLNDVPEPSEIPYQLEATGADFDEKLPNPPGMVEKYKTTNNKAALNLGVYATDIGYVAVYEKVQNALDYIKGVKDLGDKLGISNAFDQSTIERFESNLTNIDTLTAIINSSLATSDKYLKDNERNSIAALIFAGSFIEGIYISTQLIANYPKDLLPEDARNQVLIPLVLLTLKQDNALNDLIAALKSLEAEEEITSLISDLEALAQLYKDLNIDEQIKNNRGDLILTDKTLDDITKKVAAIRGGIVG